jgi:hypothetical protein
MQQHIQPTSAINFSSPNMNTFGDCLAVGSSLAKAARTLAKPAAVRRLDTDGELSLASWVWVSQWGQRELLANTTDVKKPL